MAEPQHLIDARLEVARLYAKATASQDEVDAARAKYVTAKIDAAIRKTIQQNAKGARMDDVQVAHLVGLIMGEAGVNYDTWTAIEPMIRAAVLRAQNGGL